MKKVFRALLVCMLVAALAATSFVIPASAAKVDEGSSVGTIFNDQRVRSHDKKVVQVSTKFPDGSTINGSAFVFAKNAVMTAAHCVYDANKGGFGSSQLIASEYYNKKYNVKNFKYSSSIIGTSTSLGGNWDYNNDWVILETEENIGDDLGYFAFSSYVTINDKLTVTGYPFDKGGDQYCEKGDSIYVAPNYINTQISIVKGNSGGPIYKNENGNDVVVGIVISECGYYNSARRIDSYLFNKMMEYRHHFHIKYNANGGSGNMEETVVEYGYGGNLRKNTFTRDAYNFAGWAAYRSSDKKWFCKNPNTGEEGWYTKKPEGWVYNLYDDCAFVSQTSSVNNDTITMYAQWKEAKAKFYTIKYYPEGGTGPMADTTVYYGTGTPLRKNAFQKSGRHFTGWTAYRKSDKKWCYKNPDTGNPEWYTEKNWDKYIYKDEQKTATAAGYADIIEMHAQWDEPSTYTIHYNANGGSGTMSSTKVTYGVTTMLSANKFTNGEKQFTGWYGKNSDGKWYYENPKDTSQAGWYYENKQETGWVKHLYKDCAKVAKSTSVDNGFINLYAQWSATYTIEYKANGGKGTMNTTTVNYGVSTKLSANTFTYGSRKFLGWIATINNMVHLYENPKNPSETEWLSTANNQPGWQDHIFKDGDAVYNLTGVDGACVTMTAQWSSPTACTIYYDSNGGNGNMEPTVIEYSSISGKLSKNTFTKDNYNFVGWTVNYKIENRSSFYWLYENPENLSEKGWYSEESAPEGWTKHIYKDGDAFEPNSKHDKYKITMCAQWEENNNPPTYTITIEYNANGGSGTMDVTQCTCNVPTKLAKNTFTNGENKFAGWSAHRSSDDKWFYRNPKNGAYSGWYKENSQPAGWTKALYSNGSCVTMSSDFKNDKITLYAQWKKIGTNLSNNNTTEVIKGDVNGDGKLTINDITKVQRYLAEFESFDEYQMKAADVNNDGEVDIKDITAMQCLINN